MEEDIPDEIEDLKGEDYENKQQEGVIEYVDPYELFIKQPTHIACVKIIRIESLRRRMGEFTKQMNELPVSTENKDWHVGAMWGLNKAELLFKDMFKDLMEESKIKCKYCGKILLADEEDLCSRCLKEARCEG